MTTATATMTPARTGVLAQIASFFATVGAVHRVKIAVESGRKPAKADLDILGIDPASMPKMAGARV